MSTPQQQPQKGARRSARRHRQTQQSKAAETTQSLSEADNAPRTHHMHSTVQSTPQKEVQNNKRKSRASKKTEDGAQSDGMYQPSVTPQTKATPVKQTAYAGPTFHASPAPSALPLPSFYSKSVPNVSIINPPDVANDSGADSTIKNGQFENKIGNERETNKRESTPLDWMFEAARQSKGTPLAESPSSRSINFSSYGDSPYTRSPAPRESDVVFPFELEGNDTDPGDVGEAFATPYKERIEALRLASATGSMPGLDERERQAKSEALKKLLMNSQPPRSASASPHLPDPENPFNARPPQARNLNHPQQQFRHLSGPSTPVPFYGQQAPAAPYYLPAMPPMANNQQNYQQNNNSPMHKPPSSQLRHVYQPSTESSPVELSSGKNPSQPLISTARKQPAQNQMSPQNHNDLGLATPPTEQNSRHRSKPSAQQLEDDLKRFLKIDVKSKG